MFATALSLVLMAATPTQPSPTPALVAGEALVVDGAAAPDQLRLPDELEQRRLRFQTELADLQARFAAARDHAEARELQIAIRDAKLGFEIALMEYQLDNARAASKATDTERLEATIASLRKLLSPAAAAKLATESKSGAN